MASINDSHIGLPSPKIDFTWDPVGGPVAFSFAGNSYPPTGPRFEAFLTPILETLTFTAIVLEEVPGVPIVQYRWNLGDGTVKYGPEISHVYTVPNPTASAALEVTDALNRKTYVSHILLLQALPSIVVGEHIRIGDIGLTVFPLPGGLTLLADTPLVPGGIEA